MACARNYYGFRNMTIVLRAQGQQSGIKQAGGSIPFISTP
jgi:hypothetical protein